MTAWLTSFLATCFLAYSNGANDNFKGVATLFGSGTTDYRGAIWWATLTTFAGSVFSVFMAGSLMERFSGEGLVPDAFLASPEFLLSVAVGAGFTVILATLTGFPISTTHSLTGALLGSGLVAVGTQVNFALLGGAFFLPLLASPLIAAVLGAVSYFLFRDARVRLGITKEWCVCIGETERVIPMPQVNPALAFSSAKALETVLDTEENCAQRYTGEVLGINCQKALDIAHYLSAGVVSFARGLNDTPKIVALLLALRALGVPWGMTGVAVAMAVGGLLNARRVAETMSHRITPLNHGQGFTANLVTGALVIFASRLGMPVSTTHVSVGSLFGIGLVTGEADLRVVYRILLSWILTLPIAAILSGGVYWALNM
ncbi:MAG: phosphate permease [Candidatus Handelsmanbacteria bacterium RIFCSPLOWO2_12_FULL_64_10]|uniref:Phosphate transporter n=1 Tax=Handelsmanbacteria sp. (strain RIFCSPLOWO2_12_FULL_64_10) TaxID=1817868 RepID=A0A1F6D0I5_HANXR|nr:MAG: phosphate permease [Candidatus Handelsmanbacteria bacterium RIFCSPLOWO2_12_FULL_64_10]